MKQHILIQLLFLISVTLLLSSCSRKITNISPSYSTFNGLNNDFKNVDLVNIVFVHGTGTQGIDTFDKFSNNLAKSSGFSFDKTKDITVPNKKWFTSLYLNPELDLSDTGNVRITQYSKSVKNDLNKPVEKKLRIYSVNWSNITIETKTWLKDHDQDKRRLFVNKEIKCVVTDKFSDLVLYTGQFKKLIQLVALVAIGRTSAVDPFAPEDELVFDFNQNQKNILMGGSMGSTIIWDIIHNNYEGEADPKNNVVEEKPFELLDTKNLDKEQANSPKPFLENFYKDLDRIYLMSNQLPLLGLYHVNPSLQDVNKIESSVYRHWGNPHRSLENVKLIALNDPNDVLGFSLPNSLGNENIINIKYWNSKFRFLFSNPAHAHTGWKKNKKILRLIQEGIH